jgi:hypothetical protein
MIHRRKKEHKQWTEMVKNLRVCLLAESRDRGRILEEEEDQRRIGKSDE